MSDVAIVGAGQIGVPWAAVLAAELGVEVTCIDIDEQRVETLRDGAAPFDEPGLAEYLSTGVERGTLRATTDPAVIAEHRYVAFAINAGREGMVSFMDAIRSYAEYLDDETVVINRTTLPIDMIEWMRQTVTEHAEGSPAFTVFPERLAEGNAIAEVETLPKVVGVDDDRGRAAMRELLDGLNCEIQFTDPETAMFVKLIDNSYRDAKFAIANQIAFTADELGLDAHEAISIANSEYPRNDIPSPGPVGGRCLPKDPHFLTDERVCDQPTTPDLFNATRRTNASLSSYVMTRILTRRPSAVAILGLSYKRGVADTYNSPARTIAEGLSEHGVAVSAYDPYVTPDRDLDETIAGADIVVYAVDHGEFERIEATINDHSPAGAVVFDLWGALDRTELDRSYDGFGVAADRPPGPTSTDWREAMDDPATNGDD